MSDITLVGLITRTALSLADLDLNDHVNFILGVPFLGGQGRYTRNSQGGTYMDGEVTVNRRLPNIVENIVVEVRGGTWGEVETNVATLVAAFKQDSYQLKLTVNGTQHNYQCEAADWSYDLSTGRVASNMPKFIFEVPRRPIPLVGSF